MTKPNDGLAFIYRYGGTFLWRVFLAIPCHSSDSQRGAEAIPLYIQTTWVGTRCSASVLGFTVPDARQRVPTLIPHTFRRARSEADTSGSASSTHRAQRNPKKLVQQHPPLLFRPLSQDLLH